MKESRFSADAENHPFRSGFEDVFII